MTTLTMPAAHFCPTCGVHNRHDGVELLAQCPVCAPLDIPTGGSSPAALPGGGSERGREAAPPVGSLDAWAWGRLRWAAAQAVSTSNRWLG